MSPAGTARRSSLSSRPFPRLADDVPSDWRKALHAALNADSFEGLERFLEEEHARGIHMCPPRQQIFAALEHTRLTNVKVVILGQDPYPTRGNANGLAFSVSPGVKIPASLRNIFKSLQTNYDDWRAPTHGDLSQWAKQGVLLLNTVLTVREGEPNSHRGKGWEDFTVEVLKKVNEQATRTVFLCFGVQAQKIGTAWVDSQRHSLMSAPHPSPLNGGRFVETVKQLRLFRAVDAELKSAGRDAIRWQLP